MKHNFHKVLKLFVLFIPVTILLNSCGRDFKSVENFVNNHHAAIKNSSDLVAQDIYDSCLRRVNYIILTASNGIETREETLQKCNSENKPNISRVKIANRVLLNYMEQLGQVASGKTVSFDENIADLKIALTNLNAGGFIPESAVQAGTNLFQIFVNALSKEKRGRALKKAILCADDSLQNYIPGNSSLKDNQQQNNGGLIKIAQIYTNTILEVEKKQINSYYETYLAPLEEFTDSQIPIALEVQKDYNEAMKIVQDKKDNAQNYIEILQATANAHSKLKDVFQGTGKNAISTEEKKQLCQSVLAETGNDLEKNNLSTKLDLKESEMIKAQEILSEYSQKVKFLHKNRTL